MMMNYDTMEEIDLSQFGTEELEGIVRRTLERKVAKVESLKEEMASLEGHKRDLAEALLVRMILDIEDIRYVIDGTLGELEMEVPESTSEMEDLFEEACLEYSDSLTDEEAFEELVTLQVIHGTIDSILREFMYKVGMDLLNHPKLARTVTKDTDIPWILGLIVMSEELTKNRYFERSNLDKRTLDEIRRLYQ